MSILEKMEFYDIGVRDYKQILNSIQIGYGFDFSYYSPIVFRRKILELMTHYKVDNIDELKFYLENRYFNDDFFRFFYTPTPEMFRDPSFWRKIIYFILNNISGRNQVCFPECVIGNELLSFLIILQELQVDDIFEIIITNHFPMEINSLSIIIEKRKFELSKANFERIEIKNTNLEKYFDRDNKGNYIFKNDKDINKIKFIQHDFLKKPLVNKQNMIFFRNQLLYFMIPTNEQITKNIADSLKPKGMLFLGIKEKINNCKNFRLELIDKSECIYQRK